MKSFLFEPFNSVKNRQYGQLATAKSVKEVTIYWLKWSLLLGLIPALIVIYSLTYLIPQLPKIVSSSFPNGDINVQDGKLTSTLEKKQVYSDSNLSISVDPEIADGTTISPPKSDTFSFLINDKSIYISSGSKPFAKATDLKSFPNMTINRVSLTSWLQTNKSSILMSLIAAILVSGILSLIFHGLVQFLFSIIIISLIYLLFKKSLNKILFSDLLKLGIAALVPWMILDLIVTSLISIPAIWILSNIFYLYLVINWLKNLPIKK